MSNADVQKLPKRIDPRHLARQGETLIGQLPISEMPRIVELSPTSEEVCDVRLMFKRDEAGLVVIEGHIETVLTLNCQRCFESMRYEIAADFMVSPVITDTESLPSAYEPWVLDDEGYVAINELVEDELLLNVPVAPLHEAADCPVQEIEVTNHDVGEADEEKENPFAILAKLKDKKS